MALGGLLRALGFEGRFGGGGVFLMQGGESVEVGELLEVGLEDEYELLHNFGVVIVGLVSLFEFDDLFEARAELLVVLWGFHHSNEEFDDVAVEEIETGNVLYR